MRKLIQICLLVVSFTSALAAQAPSIDWEREKAEILTHYRALIQIDTSSPPGNETRVVETSRKSSRTPAFRQRRLPSIRTGRISLHGSREMAQRSRFC
jgi:hypothetical protein